MKECTQPTTTSVLETTDLVPMQVSSFGLAWRFTASARGEATGMRSKREVYIVYVGGYSSTHIWLIYAHELHGVVFFFCTSSNL